MTNTGRSYRLYQAQNRKRTQHNRANTELDDCAERRIILDHRILDRNTEHDLLARASAGDENAMNEIVRHNQRLVYSIAKRYLASGNCGDQTIDDLAQLGNLGLLKAIRKWDCSKTLRFSTYAYHWINSMIRRYGPAQGNLFGMTFVENAHKASIRRARSKLLTQLGQEPTHKEIADEIRCSEQLIEFSLSSSPVDEDVSDIQYLLPPIKDPELILIEDEPGCDPKGKALLLEAIETLDEREKDVIVSLFGLADGITFTYDELGERYQIKPREIRALERKALARLRDSLNLCTA